MFDHSYETGRCSRDFPGRIIAVNKGTFIHNIASYFREVKSNSPYGENVMSNGCTEQGPGLWVPTSPEGGLADALMMTSFSWCHGCFLNNKTRTIFCSMV